jgi:hypothetical protein
LQSLKKLSCPQGVDPKSSFSQANIISTVLTSNSYGNPFLALNSQQVFCKSLPKSRLDVEYKQYDQIWRFIAILAIFKVFGYFFLGKIAKDFGDFFCTSFTYINY